MYTLNLKIDEEADWRMGIDLALITSGVAEFHWRNLQRPITRVAPRDGQSVVIRIGSVANRQQLNIIFSVFHPRNLVLLCHVKRWTYFH